MNPIPEAVQLFDEGKVNDAVNLLMDHVNQLSEEDNFSVGELLQHWGFLDEAKEVFEKLLRKHPNDVEIKLMLADIYVDLEEDENALQLIEDISPNDPQYIRALVVLADIYQAQGLVEVAELKLLEAKRLAPKNEMIDLGLAELYFYAGDFKKAITYYEKLKKAEEQFPFIDFNERLAECYAQIGKWEEALDVYKDLDLDSPDELFKYGYTAFQVKRFDIAIRVWEDLISLDENYTSVYPYLAQAYEEEGLVKEANEILKKGLQKDEYNIELYLTIAKNELKLNELDEAKNYLKQAIALDPGHEDAINTLINIYLDEEDYDQAKKLIDELMKFKPYPEILEWHAATIYNELEMYEEARKMYEQAALLFEDNPQFQKEYGFFLIEEGKVNKAIELLQKYVKSFPEDMEVVQYLERFDINE